MSPAWTSRAALALAFMGGSLAGCGSSPDTRFYTLATVPPITKTADRSSTPQVGVGIRSVVLPADLDRPQIVTRTGPNTVHLAEFDRWSSPLRESVANVIAENLSVLLPADRVAVYPWPPGVSIDYQVIVESPASNYGWTARARSTRGGASRRKTRSPSLDAPPRVERARAVH